MIYYVWCGDIWCFVIKCCVDNQVSNVVVWCNYFMLEGCMKQVEYFNGDYYDVNMYVCIIDVD